MKTYTTEQIIEPFPKLITDTHTIIFDIDERTRWYRWDVYSNKPLKGLGGGSSPTFSSAIETAMKEYNIVITHQIRQ